MKVLFIASALCMALPAMAAGHLCDSVEGVARTVMQARQNGASMGKVMEVTMKIPDKAVLELARSIVETAYAKPHFRTDANKTRAIEDHGNEWAAVCWRRNK